MGNLMWEEDRFKKNKKSIEKLEGKNKIKKWNKKFTQGNLKVQEIDRGEGGEQGWGEQTRSHSEACFERFSSYFTKNKETI